MNKLFLLYFLTSLIFSVELFAQQKINLHLNEFTDFINPNIFSRGYYLGTVTRAASRGRLWNTFEGSLLLGLNSTIGPIYDTNCVQDAQAAKKSAKSCRIGENPWNFSSFNTSFEKYFTQRPGLVLVRYVGYNYVPILETKEVVKEAWDTNDQIVLPTDRMDVKGLVITKAIKYGEGFIFGRVVRASLEGTVLRTFEVTIQGAEGDIFYAMSVPSEKLMDFIVMSMITGRMVRVHYLTLYSIEAFPGKLRGYDTDYRVIGIEVQKF